MANVVAVLPTALLGSLALLIREDFALTDTQLGFGTSMFFGISALASPLGGWISERAGAYPATRAASLLSASVLLGIAVLADSWATLLVLLGLAGLANAVVHPATNLSVFEVVDVNRRGLMFGIKQASTPIATFLAGILMSIIALPLGWRWAYVVAAMLGMLSFLATPPRSAISEPVSKQLYVRRKPLLVLSVAVTLATIAGTSVSTFYVNSAVHQGHLPSASGLLLAIGGVLTVVGRVGWGWLSDARDRLSFLLMSGLLFCGGAGYILLGYAGSGVALWVATWLVFGFGMGWSGIFHKAVVGMSGGAAARATGLVLVGPFIGGVLGPSLFGGIAQYVSYRAAWWFVGGTMLCSSALVAFARRTFMTSPLP